MRPLETDRRLSQLFVPALWSTSLSLICVRQPARITPALVPAGLYSLYTLHVITVNPEYTEGVLARVMGCEEIVVAEVSSPDSVQQIYAHHPCALRDHSCLTLILWVW